MRILIVDDSVTIRDRLAEALSGLSGVEHVHLAASTLDAIRAVHSGWPDAVVLEINMPRGSGPRVLEAVSSAAPRIVSIVLTNDATVERRQACLLAGADFFFDKSWGFHLVVDVLARLARGDANSLALPPCWACFDQLSVPVWLYDVDTLALRAVNDAAVARYGYSRETFLTMTFADIQVCDGRFERDPVSSERRRETPQIPGRQRHRHRSGAVLDVEVAVSLLSHDDGRLAVALVHNINERAVAESESPSRNGGDRKIWKI